MPQAVVQTGFFYVERGSLQNPEEEEGQEKARVASHGDSPVPNGSIQDGGKVPGTNLSGAKNELSTAKDICYNDDLIVDGSLCVGFDCTCNYSFGFDTIVLKENNLRIFFDDTSTAASFPRNDWRIIINDSANGGASYFGVEDSTAGRRPFTVEAGARSHSLYVDDGGRIGIRTSTPSVEIHVVDGDTPTLRLAQDGSSGFAPQTWDVAGNETNFFVRDVTNGSTLPFRIQPDAPNNVLTIRADGRVGQGTWSPSYTFHQLTDSSTNAQFVAERTSGARCLLSGTAAAGFFGTLNNFPVRITVNDTQRAQFNNDNSVTMANGASLTSGGIWTDASSRELKDNIDELSQEDADKALKGLNPVTYNYKAEASEKHVGFIAEEVPELVAMNNRKGLAPMEIVAVLTKVLKQQQALNQNQQDTISEMKKRIEELEKNTKSDKK
ncbi:MAG: tail fiber domain-containing protein [bacterium]|nr:tail fiber domain-containing protein [bacterium]